MKRIVIALCLFVAVAANVSAQPQPPLEPSKLPRAGYRSVVPDQPVLRPTPSAEALEREAKIKRQSAEIVALEARVEELEGKIQSSERSMYVALGIMTLGIVGVIVSVGYILCRRKKRRGPWGKWKAA